MTVKLRRVGVQWGERVGVGGGQVRGGQSVAPLILDTYLRWVVQTPIYNSLSSIS